MLFLNWLSVSSTLVSYFILDQRYGPKYLSECFPNEVLLSSRNPAFLRIYCVVLVSNNSSTLYMNTAMSCRRMLCSYLSLALSNNSLSVDPGGRVLPISR